MEVTLLKCPSCGAPIGTDTDGKDFICCEYCGSRIHLDNEKKDKPPVNPEAAKPEKNKKSVFEKIITVSVFILFLIVLIIVFRTFYANGLFRSLFNL